MNDMATTLTLNDKYPDWNDEDWKRYHWLNSWDRRRRNLAPLVPCKRCGRAPVFEEDHIDIPFHNMFFLGCPKCHRNLETTYSIGPVRFLGGFGAEGASLSVVNNRTPLHLIRAWNKYNSPLA
jgi:hypothetical protein